MPSFSNKLHVQQYKSGVAASSFQSVIIMRAKEPGHRLVHRTREPHLHGWHTSRRSIIFAHTNISTYNAQPMSVSNGSQEPEHKICANVFTIWYLVVWSTPYLVLRNSRMESLLVKADDSKSASAAGFLGCTSTSNSRSEIRPCPSTYCKRWR